MPKGGSKEEVGGTGPAISGDMVKLHVAPLDSDIVWVSAHSAISEARTACIATDLSQLPFLRCGFSNSVTGSVQEVVQWMCRRVMLNSIDPTRRRSCEGNLNSAADLTGFASCRRPDFHSFALQRPVQPRPVRGPLCSHSVPTLIPFWCHCGQLWVHQAPFWDRS